MGWQSYKKKKKKKAIYYDYHLTRDDTKRRKISRNRDREKFVTRKICEEKFERGWFNEKWSQSRWDRDETRLIIDE